MSASQRDPGTGTGTSGGEAEPAATPRMTGHDTGPDSPASPADTVSGETENGEIRLDTVQASGAETTKVRHDPVQMEAPADWENPALLPPKWDGQDSREFCSEPFQLGKTDKKAQGIVDLPGWNIRNLGETYFVPSREKLEVRRAKAARLPHETESEIPEKMHETTSESGRPGAGTVHETKSEFRETLHETESESGGTMAETLHEMTSESGAPAQESVHEIRSEVREAVHEMESELTDRVSRSILEGLRRAAAVR